MVMTLSLLKCKQLFILIRILIDLNDTFSVQKHIKYNYSFGLTGNIILDSHSIGNETRYLNHSDDPNCIAKSNIF